MLLDTLLHTYIPCTPRFVVIVRLRFFLSFYIERFFFKIFKCSTQIFSYTRSFFTPNSVTGLTFINKISIHRISSAVVRFSSLILLDSWWDLVFLECGYPELNDMVPCNFSGWMWSPHFFGRVCFNHVVFSVPSLCFRIDFCSYLITTLFFSLPESNNRLITASLVNIQSVPLHPILWSTFFFILERKSL